MIIDRRGVVGFGALLALGGAGSAQAISYKLPDYYIYFDHASTVLEPASLFDIDNMKSVFEAWAADYKQPTRYLLSGSIDGAEAAAGLQALKDQRIEAVRKALVAAGIDPALISTAPPFDSEFVEFKNGDAEPTARAVHVRMP